MYDNSKENSDVDRGSLTRQSRASRKSVHTIPPPLLGFHLTSSCCYSSRQEVSFVFNTKLRITVISHAYFKISMCEMNRHKSKAQKSYQGAGIDLVKRGNFLLVIEPEAPAYDCFKPIRKLYRLYSQVLQNMSLKSQEGTRSIHDGGGGGGGGGGGSDGTSYCKPKKNTQA